MMLAASASRPASTRCDGRGSRPSGRRPPFRAPRRRARRRRAAQGAKALRDDALLPPEEFQMASARCWPADQAATACPSDWSIFSSSASTGPTSAATRSPSSSACARATSSASSTCWSFTGADGAVQCPDHSVLTVGEADGAGAVVGALIRPRRDGRERRAPSSAARRARADAGDLRRGGFWSLDEAIATTPPPRSRSSAPPGDRPARRDPRGGRRSGRRRLDPFQPTLSPPALSTPRTRRYRMVTRHA